MSPPSAPSLARRGATRPAVDSITADRQLHFICEGWKRGLDFARMRQLVAKTYGPGVKLCQLHWTEIDRLIIEIWRLELRKNAAHL
jgi:hypothetical protein